MQFYIARMLKRPDMDNQTRYGHVEKVRRLPAWGAASAACSFQTQSQALHKHRHEPSTASDNLPTFVKLRLMLGQGAAA